MTRSPRNLSKHDVEQMMDAVGGSSASALEEITVMRAALRDALVKLLAMPEVDPAADPLIDPPGELAVEGPDSVPTGAFVADVGESSWLDLVTAAAEVGQWSPERREVLIRAEHPDRAPDPEAVLDALWDLAQELNELRTIAPTT